RHRGAGLAEAWLESAARRAASCPRTRLSDGALLGGNRGDHRMPGGHGKGTHVSCPREIAPVSAELGRRRGRIAGGARMTHDSRHHAWGEHREVSALLPWYVNGSIGEQDRQRVDPTLSACADSSNEL